MKILLISPARDIHAYTNKGILIPQLALFILEGLTPKKHPVKIIEEEYMPINFEEDCDVVGISCMTSNAYRGYKIAKEYKRRGKIVIMGGVHPSILPDEALQYADSVVIGEAEGIWEQVLMDIESNKLQKKYQNAYPDLSRYIPKNYSLVKKKQFFNLLPIQTTRGCPYNCEFCCVSDLYGKKIKHVPIKNVVKEIVDSKSKKFIFLDDNIVGNRKYARQLFEAIIPLKIKWIGQASISFANDIEMMKLARKSGCLGLFIGLERVVDNNDKRFKKLGKLDDTIDALKKIRKMGIVIMASVIFGFDEDTHDTFDQTVKFLIKNKISIASLNILTPYPGTKTYENLKREGRLITEKWEYYDHHTAVFQPKNMTALELQLGKINAKIKFYTLWNIIRRFRGSLFSPIIYIGSNLGYRRIAKSEKKRIANIEINSQSIDKHEVFLNTFIQEEQKEDALII